MSCIVLSAIQSACAAISRAKYYTSEYFAARIWSAMARQFALLEARWCPAASPQLLLVLTLMMISVASVLEVHLLQGLHESGFSIISDLETFSILEAPDPLSTIIVTWCPGSDDRQENDELRQTHNHIAYTKYAGEALPGSDA